MYNVSKSDPILFTGVAGFMSSAIAKEFVRLGYTNLHGLDDLSGGFLKNVPKEVNFKKIDLRNYEETYNFVQEIKPKYLFHLAANARECASFFQPKDAVDRNLLAYVNVLEPCIKFGLEKVVLFSSMSRYGDQIPPFDESMSPKPVDVYASNKVAMEEITKQLAGCHNFRWTIIVPRNVYGPSQCLKDRFRNYLGISMNHIMRGEDLVIYGTGNNLRSFSYIENSLPCYIKCLESSVDSEVINIGGLVAKSIKEVADIIISNFKEYNPKIKYLPPRYGEVEKAWATYDKSVKLLGYKEVFSLEEGIAKMSEWAKKEGPKEWSSEQLSLINDKVPETWR